MPSADRLEQLTNQLVNMAEADMVTSIDATEEAYKTSRLVVVSFILGSILLALGLGCVISWSLIEPVKKIETRLRQIAAGDFAQQVAIDNVGTSLECSPTMSTRPLPSARAPVPK